MSTPIDGIASLREPTSADGPDTDPASAFEAYILRRMLSEMRPASGWSGGGIGGDTFSGMFEEAIADQLAKAGGLGLADALRTTMGEPPPGTSGEAASDAIALMRLHAQIDTAPLENSTAPPQLPAEVVESTQQR